MNEIAIDRRPYDEEGVLNLYVFASSFPYSGGVEIYTTPHDIEGFGRRLAAFPAHIGDSVRFEYGNRYGECIAPMVLEAQVTDGVGHSAIFVSMQSFTDRCRISAEFPIPAEPAAINEYGRALAAWARDPTESLVWRFKA